MDLRALEKHTRAAAALIISDVVNSAADTLADSTADPRDSLAALRDAAVLLRISSDARSVRKERG
jgi:hypothetical protein